MAIQGAYEGRALVAMIDKGSDPQENVAELLTSSGFAAPVLVTSSMNQQADLKPLAEVHGEIFLQFEVWYKYDIKVCLKYTRWIFFCILRSCFFAFQYLLYPLRPWPGAVLSFPLMARQCHCLPVLLRILRSSTVTWVTEKVLFIYFPRCEAKKSLVKLSLNLYWSNNSQMKLSNGSSTVLIGFMITVNPSYLKQCCGYELTAVLLFHTIDWYCGHKYACFLLMIELKSLPF